MAENYEAHDIGRGSGRSRHCENKITRLVVRYLADVPAGAYLSDDSLGTYPSSAGIISFGVPSPGPMKVSHPHPSTVAFSRVKFMPK